MFHFFPSVYYSGKCLHIIFIAAANKDFKNNQQDTLVFLLPEP